MILGIDPGIRKLGYAVVSASSPDFLPKKVKTGIKVKVSDLDGYLNFSSKSGLSNGRETPQPPLLKGENKGTPQSPLLKGENKGTPQPPLLKGENKGTPQSPLLKGENKGTPQSPLLKGELNIIDTGAIVFDSKSMKDRIAQYERMNEILEFFEKILSEYDIRTIVMERYFFTKYNLSNAEFVYGVRGILLSLAIRSGIKILEYTPLELKKYITGNSRASKDLVKDFVSKIYGIKNDIKYDDISDALGLAYMGRVRGG